MTDWTLKTVALLHDPPSKILKLEGHRRRAFELIEQAIGSGEFQRRFGKSAGQLTGKDFEATPEGRFIKEADRIASAIDRAAFPNEVRLESAEFSRNIQVRHPFCGEPLPLPLQSGSGDQYTEEILRFVSRQPNPRTKYLALWRMLPFLTPDTFVRLLPPDTRIIDHALWAHLDTSSGLVSALPEVAMLHVGIGPVQTFIYEARRTQDLWMGSYLLSFLTWAGIKVIADTYGPDAVLFPSLREQPLVDKWLKEELGALPTMIRETDATIGALPNKFIALVPAQDISHLADQVMGAIRRMWREITEEVRRDFPGGPREGAWHKIWERQTQRDDWPEIYWSAVVWPNVETYPLDKGAEEALRRVEICLGEQELYRKRLSLYLQNWKKGTNTGGMYDALYELLAVAMEARKRSRDFFQGEEDGEKCNVIPALSALRTETKQRRGEVRNYWREVAGKLRERGRVHDLRADGRERLSAVAAVKRFSQHSYFARKEGPISFPSTSRVAAVPFYQELFRKLAGNSTLQNALKEHLSSLERLGYQSRAAKGALPGLEQELEHLQSKARTDAEEILSYEADVLYPERLDPQLLEREYDLTIRQAALRTQQTCRCLRKEVGIAPPAYYGVLLMDGDDIGEWLAGKHNRMPLFRDVMHPDVLPKFNTLPNSAGWDAALKEPRPLAANLHATLSAALSTFSLRCVRWVVEQRHFGRVVYSGGDDLLALLPLVETMPAAYELYALFTGRAKVQNNSLLVDGAPRRGFVEWNDEILVMPGPRITLSAGISIVHHLYPLDAALEAAREAERDAKRVNGKAAVAVGIIKRSGETVTVRSKWDSMGNLFNEMVGYFAVKRVSSRFAYDLSDQSHILTALPARARKAMLKQLVERHQTDRLGDPAGSVDRLWQWAQDLDGQVPPDRLEGRGIPQGFAELARWVMFARFVSQGGGE